jgi:hypothetical protein
MLASTGALDVLSRLAQPWATLYADHSWLQTTTLFLHLAGIFLGGGFAIATDRDTFIAVRAARLSGQIRHLGRIRTIHKPVMFGLALALGSGFLLFAGRRPSGSSRCVSSPTPCFQRGPNRSGAASRLCSRFQGQTDATRARLAPAIWQRWRTSPAPPPDC